MPPVNVHPWWSRVIALLTLPALTVQRGQREYVVYTKYTRSCRRQCCQFTLGYTYSWSHQPLHLGSRINKITFLSQYNARGIRAAFPGESEQPQYGATQLSSPLLCAVFTCFHTTGCEAYSFATDKYVIFNVRKKLVACRTHGSGSGTKKPAQKLTRA